MLPPTPSPPPGRRALARAGALALAAALAFGCGGGYVTETSRGVGVREWFLEIPGGRIEAFLLSPPDRGSFLPWSPNRGPFPALLLLHAASARAQRYRRAMFDLAQRGLVVMSISLPGFGESTGPDDLAGPRSVAAAARAAEYLAGLSYVQPDAIAAYGLGQGAATALLAAARSSRIRLVAVEGGFYDLAKAYTQLPPARKERVRFLLGGTPEERPEAYRQRSALHEIGKFRGPILILHARRSRTYPLSQAQALAAALARAGLPHRLTILPRDTHTLTPKQPSLRDRVLPFMREHLALRGPVARGAKRGGGGR